MPAHLDGSCKATEATTTTQVSTVPRPLLTPIAVFANQLGDIKIARGGRCGTIW
jgi:hypothetical protein